MVVLVVVLVAVQATSTTAATSDPRTGRISTSSLLASNGGFTPPLQQHRPRVPRGRGVHVDGHHGRGAVTAIIGVALDQRIDELDAEP